MYCPVCSADYPADWKVCPKDATNLLTSSVIGKYQIEGLLGTGGMGAVYRAINPDTRGRVAIKLMNPAVAGSESARARFQREAAAVAALRTSHVVTVYDFGEDDLGTMYLVMELLDGHPLRAEIRPGPDYMDLARVNLVLDGALKGLAAAHRAGIVHRDLKPENVFVADTDDGEVAKLLDFGIARVRTRDSDLTRTGSMMGTAAYMAVEQVASGSGEIGPWSDVYAMGAILYELLAGTAAYAGETVTETLHRVLTAERRPLAEARAGLPEAVYALVDRCLSLEPTARPRDAEAMRAELRAVQLVAPGTVVPPARKTTVAEHAPVGLLSTAGHDTPPAVTPPPTVPPPPTGAEDAPSPGRRARWPLIAAGVAIASAGGFAVVRTIGGDTPAPRDAGVALAGDATTTATGPADAAAHDPWQGPGPDATLAAVDDAAATVDPDVAHRDATMIRIAAGSYTIGEPGRPHPDALPEREVELRALWIDRHEVRLGELRAALRDRKAGGAPDDDAALPARHVTWQQARAACTARGKRLPREAEWEVAARTTPKDRDAAMLMRTRPALVEPDGRDCSAAGLCDMLGSVVEWTMDDWAGKQGYRVVRGASFAVAPTGWAATIHARTAVRAQTSDSEVGFRCVLDDDAPVPRAPASEPP